MHDFFSGAWILVLAAQRTNLDISYTEAGIAQAAYMTLSAVTQPFIGNFFDRTGKPYLALWAVGLAAIMTTLAAMANNYLLFIILGMGAGVASAIFHAAGLSGAKQLAAGRGEGSATAIFLLGGNGGFALGAFAGGVILDNYGASTMALPAIIAVFFTPFLMRFLRPYLQDIPNKPERTSREILLGGRRLLLPIAAYIIVVAVYQLFQGGFSTYLPQFYEEQGNSLTYAGQFSGLYLFFGAVGSFAGGMLVDRFSRRWVAITSFLLIAPFSFLILRSGGGIGLGALSIILGLLSNLSLPILLLIGQEVLPGGKSGAGGFTFGLTFLTRGIMTTLVGVIADNIGLLETLTLIGVLPILAIALFFVLPDHAPPKAVQT